MSKVNFLLIGAQKAGTSWLASMLYEHPDVFRSEVKELHFFNLRERFQQGVESYAKHFEAAAGQTAVGECTPNYLWVCDAPECVQDERQRLGKRPLDFVNYGHVIRNVHELVHEHLPDVKLIVSLRNPVDRAVSSYYHAIRARRVSPRASILDVGGQEGILGMGFYYRHLLEWTKLFPRERFLILIYEEDIQREKPRTLKRVFGHLGVDTTFEPPERERRVNVRASGAFMRANYYAPRLARHAFRLVPQLNKLGALEIRVSDAERAELADIYRSENERLEEFLGRSLDCWRSVPVARS